MSDTASEKLLTGMGSASLSLRMMAFSTLCSTAVAATNSMRRRLFARLLEASGLRMEETRTGKH